MSRRRRVARQKRKSSVQENGGIILNEMMTDGMRQRKMTQPVGTAMNGNKENHDTVENMDQDHAKTDGEIYKTEEEISESGDTTSSTTESDVTDVDMDSNTEDPFAWDKQVCCHVQVSFR